LGGVDNTDTALDPLSFDSQTTLGETPAHTTLTVQYRVGGGISANVSSGDLTTVKSSTDINGTSSGKSLTVTNENPTRGGSGGETVDEIRMKAKAFFATQNRCVTQEDYEARILNMPPKFGGIAKVFVERSDLETVFAEAAVLEGGNDTLTLNEFLSIYGQGSLTTPQLATIKVYVLSYDNNKNLTTLPASTGGIVHPLKTNIKNYLSNYRIITDEISIEDGKIVNFGVAFDVVAHRSANKADVKLRCINKIIEYFNIDKMQFHQPIYTSDLEYELMGLDGIRSVNSIILTQDFENDASAEITGATILWDYNITYDTGVGTHEEGHSGDNTYGWQYQFGDFYGANAPASVGVVLPSITPSVFELKNPKDNVKGIVR